MRVSIIFDISGCKRLTVERVQEISLRVKGRLARVVIATSRVKRENKQLRGEALSRVAMLIRELMERADVKRPVSKQRMLTIKRFEEDLETLCRQERHLVDSLCHRVLGDKCCGRMRDQGFVRRLVDRDFHIFVLALGEILRCNSVIVVTGDEPLAHILPLLQDVSGEHDISVELV